MHIRKSKISDLEDILGIYAYARKQMKKNGNPTQWGNNRPAESSVRKDIEAGDNYVIEENGMICGVFSFVLGADPTYEIIENGSWINEEYYGTIHKLASNGLAKGIFDECLRFCMQINKNIRADTHADNHIMQHILEKHGFVRCGIIYVDDGTPRVAYHKIY